MSKQGLISKPLPNNNIRSKKTKFAARGTIDLKKDDYINKEINNNNNVLKEINSTEDMQRKLQNLQHSALITKKETAQKTGKITNNESARITMENKQTENKKMPPVKIIKNIKNKRRRSNIQPQKVASGISSAESRNMLFAVQTKNKTVQKCMQHFIDEPVSRPEALYIECTFSTQFTHESIYDAIKNALVGMPYAEIVKIEFKAQNVVLSSKGYKDRWVFEIRPREARSQLLRIGLRIHKTLISVVKPYDACMKEEFEDYSSYVEEFIHKEKLARQEIERTTRTGKFMYAKATMASKAETVPDFQPISAEDMVRRQTITRPSLVKNRTNTLPGSQKAKLTGGQSELGLLTTDIPQNNAKDDKMLPSKNSLVLPDIADNLRRLANIGSLNGSSLVPTEMLAQDLRNTADDINAQETVKNAREKEGHLINSKDSEIRNSVQYQDKTIKKEEKVTREVSNLLKSSPIINNAALSSDLGTIFTGNLKMKYRVVEKGSDAYDHTPTSLYSTALALRTRKVTTGTYCNMDADPEAPAATSGKIRKQAQSRKITKAEDRNIRAIRTPADQAEYIDNKYLMQYHGIIDIRETTPRSMTMTPHGHKFLNRTHIMNNINSGKIILEKIYKENMSAFK